jgi:sialidase-1
VNIKKTAESRASLRDRILCLTSIPLMTTVVMAASITVRADELILPAPPNDSIPAVTIDVQDADLPVFTSGDGAYYRLPSILVTRGGTVLAACQKRKGSRGDWAESALVLKRSTDGGRTWGAEQTLYERSGYSVFNGNLVEDRQTGQILATGIVFPTEEGAGWFLKTWLPAGGGFDLLRSNDHGQTWSALEHCVPAPNADGWHGGAAFNNNHGVQLTRGPHAGRLVLCARVFKPGVYEGRAKGGVIYSDDHGTTWHVGGVGFPTDGSLNGEVALCETSTGEVYVNYRNTDRQADPRCRLYSRSRDGGVSFYEEGFENDLPAHGCNAGLVSFAVDGDDNAHWMLLTYPLESSRHKLTCYFSNDDGRSWSGTRVISDGGGYSDVTVLPDGTVLVLYEQSRAAGLHLARFVGVPVRMDQEEQGSATATRHQ